MTPRVDKAAGAKGAETAARILESALGMFRERGFDGTTMRDIAGACDMSLGAAYYHFKSKEALLLAYYQRLHEDRLRHGEQLFAETSDLRERVVGLYHHHLAALRDDRRLLAALVRIVADPESSASIFAPETRAIREADMKLFRQATDVADVPDELRALGALALWTLQLGLLLYFIWDESEEARRTHELVDHAVDLLLPLVPLLGTPLAAPLVGRLLATLEAAGLVADAVRSDDEPAAPRR
ncbi:MAG: TetR/AcrR family transcriptional regulator [Deltaproteobacteria bacterium]|nr:TetR/AcrR family transcriptional regulator [Deltaproteobacteria bacterium]